MRVRTYCRTRFPTTNKRETFFLGFCLDRYSWGLEVALAAAIRAVHDRVGEIHLFEQFLFLVAQYVRLLVLSVLGTVRVLVRFVGFTEFGEHGIVVLILSEDEVLELVHIERLL